VNLPYFAQYYATGSSTAGDVKATVHYTIAYE
ncbi:TPA: F17 fimbrial protein, partial [Proteus mirabilis]|nr:F17 fimbrial protein [Proteus mirabilis]